MSWIPDPHSNTILNVSTQLFRMSLKLNKHKTKVTSFDPTLTLCPKSHLLLIPIFLGTITLGFSNYKCKFHLQFVPHLLLNIFYLCNLFSTIPKAARLKGHSSQNGHQSAIAKLSSLPSLLPTLNNYPHD